MFAVDANGNQSGPSNVDSAVALDLDPSTPTGLEAVPGANEGEIDVVWNPNPEPDLDHYLLERDIDAGFPAPFEVGVSVPSFTDTGLTPGETYYYRVRAVDDNGNESGRSTPDSAIATDLPPAAPTGERELGTGLRPLPSGAAYRSGLRPGLRPVRLDADILPGLGTCPG